MKKTNVDLVVGGSILLALFILVGGVLWLKEVSVSSKMVSYTVLFENVGTLQPGDPVMVNGVRKGTVSDMYIRGTDVAVVLKLDRRIRITDLTDVIVQNIGLMGERGVGIRLTNTGNVVDPTSGRDTTFLSGKFDSGIAETMGMLGTVLTEVETLTQNVTSIIDNTIGDTAFISFYHTMVNRLDTISGMAQNLLVKNEPYLNRSIQNVTALSNDLKEFLDKNSPRLETIVSNTEELSSEALYLVSQVDTLTGSLQNIVGKIERGEGVLGQLMQDDEFYPELKSTLASIDTLVNEVHKDALRLRVRLGFRRRNR
ncbi:ABC transporter-related permease with MCE domain [Chitinispirillum alkaliphilum]|nr:ABC transporter-related permease with MCE domain [Chitinispirillum alkaliphilum]